MNEIVLAIRTTLNPRNPFKEELQEEAMDKRLKSAIKKKEYLTSPEFYVKKEKLGATRPEFGIVTSIGIRQDDGSHDVFILDDGAEDDRQLLEDFWKEMQLFCEDRFVVRSDLTASQIEEALANQEPGSIEVSDPESGPPATSIPRWRRIIGYNLIDHAIPFLMKRSAILDISVPLRFPVADRDNYRGILYDLGMNWESTSRPSTDNLMYLAKIFGVEDPTDPNRVSSEKPDTSSLEWELDVVWAIYERLKVAGL